MHVQALPETCGLAWLYWTDDIGMVWIYSIFQGGYVFQMKTFKKVVGKFFA